MANDTLKRFIEDLEKKGGKEAQLLDSDDYVVLAEGKAGALIAEHMNPLAFGALVSRLLEEHLEKQAEVDSKLTVATAIALTQMMFNTLDRVLPEDDKARETLLFHVLNDLPDEAQVSKSFYVLNEKTSYSMMGMNIAQLMAGFFATMEELADKHPTDPKGMKKMMANIIKESADRLATK